MDHVDGNAEDRRDYYEIVAFFGNKRGGTAQQVPRIAISDTRERLIPKLRPVLAPEKNRVGHGKLAAACKRARRSNEDVLRGYLGLASPVSSTHFQGANLLYQ